ncbi:MAG: sigma-70 family RNA polymerase sigma factor [Actinomycetota bacterium]
MRDRATEVDITKLLDQVPAVRRALQRRGASDEAIDDAIADALEQACRKWHTHGAEGLGVGWMITVAQRRLVDQWRRAEAERRRARLLVAQARVLDGERRAPDVASAVLRPLADKHRDVLSLRYLEGLSVADTAASLGMSYLACESLLGRARRAARAHWATAA